MDDTLPAAAIDERRPSDREATVRFLAYLVALAFAALVMRFAVYYALGGELQFTSFLSSTCKWDCHFYLELIDKGYDRIGLKPGGVSDSWAFFPLVPMLHGALAHVTNLPLQIVALVTSNAFTIAAAMAARFWFERERAAYLFGAWLLVGPLNPILSVIYTENLFILLTIVCLNALHRQRYIRAGICAALLSATRTTGVLIGFAILTRFLIDHFREGGRLLDLPVALLRRLDVVMGLALVPVGLLAFMLYLQVHAGDALGFLHSQASWGRVVLWPTDRLQEAIRNLSAPHGVPVEYVGHAYALFAGVALSIGLLVMRRLPEAAFCIAVLLISTSAGLNSLTRFMLGLAPFAIMLVDLASRWRWTSWLAYPLVIVLGLLSSYGWYDGAPYLV